MTMIDPGPPSDPGDELVEVVDRRGGVVEVVTRRRIRAETLRHRCTYVAVVAGPPDLLDPTRPEASIDGDTLVVVHQRADWKDTCPSYWDVAFGGICGVGEEWEAAALRELAEEAGIVDASLVDLGPGDYEAEDGRVVGRVYLTAWPEEPTCADGEVVAVDRVALGDLDRWVRSVPVCPDSALIVVPRLVALI